MDSRQSGSDDAQESSKGYRYYHFTEPVVIKAGDTWRVTGFDGKDNTLSLERISGEDDGRPVGMVHLCAQWDRRLSDEEIRWLDEDAQAMMRIYKPLTLRERVKAFMRRLWRR